MDSCNASRSRLPPIPGPHVNTQRLISRIVSRTGIPHDDVRAVFDALRDIAAEQVAVYEPLIIPGMMRISCKHTKWGWKLHFSPYRALDSAVGRDVQKL